MRHAIVTAVCLMCAAAAASAGEVSSTWTAVSDYDFRGVSLSAKDPALQGSLDYAHDSGFYAGAWASNLDYGSSFDGNIELDLYLGWAGEFANKTGWDAGIVWYTYPDSSSSLTKSRIRDYPEIYAGLTFGPVEVKQWYSHDYGGSSDDSFYTEMNYGFELPADFGLNLHVGYNYGKGLEDSAGTEFFDFSVGVTKTLGNFELGLKVTGTDIDEEDYGLDPGDNFPDEFNPEPRLVFSVATTFPWGGE